MRICKSERASSGEESDLESSTVDRACREDEKSEAASARSLRCLMTVSTALRRDLSCVSRASRYCLRSWKYCTPRQSALP